MKEYILAIDQGTTSSRTIIFNKKSEIVAVAQMEFTQICRQDGYVEHNPLEIFDTVYATIVEALNKSNLSLKDIAGIGITNQRETTVLWDKLTGEPVHNAICWQSRQSSYICDDLMEKGYSEFIKNKTGLLINPYFSASKIKWIFDNVEGVYEKALKGEILFGTIDTYLVWRLTNGNLHITDYTNASRTMLFNIYDLKFDEELLALFNIPSCILPKVVSNSEIYGIATKLHEIEDVDVPIASIIGDQQASLFGQCAFNLGDAKVTYGTGCFMLLNTKKPVEPKKGLLTTIAYAYNNEIEYALEGSVFIGGSAVQWLRDGLKMINKSKDVENYVLDTSAGVYVVPAFVGLGTPYWDNEVRGSIFGLTRATTKANLINATVESIAYQVKDVMEVMKEIAKVKILSLAVDGGASSNNYLMQFQADILDTKIIRPTVLETTALGAAYLAGLATDVWKDQKEILKYKEIDSFFYSQMSLEERKTKYQKWKKAVKAARVFK